MKIGRGDRARDGLGKPVLLADRLDLVGDLNARERQHLIAQRAIERRQPIEPEQFDQPAKRRPVDEEREEDEACAEDRDETLDVGGYAAFSVTASASARVTAPRSAPQRTTTL